MVRLDTNYRCYSRIALHKQDGANRHLMLSARTSHITSRLLTSTPITSLNVTCWCKTARPERTAGKAADALGYSKTKLMPNGLAVFENADAKGGQPRLITAARGRGTRSGTYNEDLGRIGD